MRVDAHVCVCVCVCVCVWEWCDTHGIALVGVAALQKMQFVANPPVIYILPFTWVVQRRRCSFNDTTRHPAPGGHDPPALATYSTTPGPPPRSPPLCLPVRRPAPAVYTLSLSLRLSPPLSAFHDTASRDTLRSPRPRKTSSWPGRPGLIRTLPFVPVVPRRPERRSKRRAVPPSTSRRRQ